LTFLILLIDIIQLGLELYLVHLLGFFYNNNSKFFNWLSSRLLPFINWNYRNKKPFPACVLA